MNNIQKHNVFLRILLLSLFFNCYNTVISQTTIKHAFPQHTEYSKYTIKPSNHGQKDLDKAVEQFYNKWKQAYIRNNCSNANQYYVLDDEEMEPGDTFKSICVSEGQGYGMLITVLMAGYDNDAQTIFNGMFRFYKAHPSSRSPYLMSWSILKDCITNKKDGNQSSASDGDFDIALSLLMASEQWGNDGEINYKVEASKIVEAILSMEINSQKHSILLSNDNKPNDTDFNDIRSSDFMPVQLRVFNKYYPNKEWLLVLEKTYKIFFEIRNKYSPKAGLIPDFIVYRKATYQPAPAHYLESKNDGFYYYNACRIPLRVGLDRILFSNKEADSLLLPLNNWIISNTNNTIEKINNGYQLNGRKIGKGYNTIPSFVCPLAVSAMIDKENQEWLNDMWDFITKEFIFKDYQYYDNSIQMLSLVVLSGNYWIP